MTIHRVAEILVGLVFLISGGAKAQDFAAFQRHVWNFRIVPYRLFPWAPMAVPVGECGIGVALIAGLSPFITLAAAAIVILFSAVATWAEATHRVKGCGCYGGLFEISAGWSLALNALYLALLAIAWSDASPVNGPAAGWRKWALVGGAMWIALVQSWRASKR